MNYSKRFGHGRSVGILVNLPHGFVRNISAKSHLIIGCLMPVLNHGMADINYYVYRKQVRLPSYAILKFRLKLTHIIQSTKSTLKNVWLVMGPTKLGIYSRAKLN